MSFGRFGKRLGCFGVSAFLWLALPALSWAQSSVHCATFGTPCVVGCQTHHCPPAYKHCSQGPPRLHWQHGCPLPIMNPCDLPHWGFYETCWNPWPFPPIWGCGTAPPASFVNLEVGVPLNVMPPVRSYPGGPVTPPGVAPQPVFPNPMPNGGPVQQLPPPRVNQFNY